MISECIIPNAFIEVSQRVLKQLPCLAQKKILG
jgi:hypothetical protein